MSDSPEPVPRGLRMPAYEPGQDETWDRLGKEWQRFDGVLDGARLYVTWVTHKDGRSELAGICIEGAPVTSELLRSVPVGRLLRAHDAESLDLAELQPLYRRKNESPDEFAGRVAWYYRVFSQITPHPAKSIAEHSHKPVGTVRGWIHEARARGKLPPGTRGRAG